MQEKGGHTKTIKKEGITKGKQRKQGNWRRKEETRKQFRGKEKKGKEKEI